MHLPGYTRLSKGSLRISIHPCSTRARNEWERLHGLKMAVFDRPAPLRRARYIIRVSSPKPAKEGKGRGSFGKYLSEQEGKNKRSACHTAMDTFKQSNAIAKATQPFSWWHHAWAGASGLHGRACWKKRQCAPMEDFVFLKTKKKDVFLEERFPRFISTKQSKVQVAQS